MTSIKVPLGEQSYDVLVEAGALNRVGQLLQETLGESTGRRILLVADAAIATLKKQTCHFYSPDVDLYA